MNARSAAVRCGRGRQGMRFVAALAWLALAGTAAAGEVPFAPAAAIDTTFGGAFAVELADLDGDGDLDAVGAAAGSGEVSWWENVAGDGSTWTEHTIDLAFSDAISVAVGDVDRDGRLDVVGAATDGEIAWWPNDGTPAAGAWTRFPIDVSFAGARAVRLADLDRDGLLDVVAAGTVADQVLWWRNDGTPLDDTVDLGSGERWVERLVGSVNGPVALAIADLDGDGFEDVLAGAQAAGQIGWWRNDGDPTDGGWTGLAIDDAITVVRSLAAADLDGDGDLDVLGTAGSGDGVSWWENDGDPLDDTADDGAGNYWTERAIATAFAGAWTARGVDLDADGDLDVVASAVTADSIAWWENDGSPADNGTDLGNGDFWPPAVVDAAVDGATDVVAGDLDGDGDLDLAATASASDDVSWWENDTIHRGALFDLSHQVASGDQPEGIALADVDGDGDLDLVGGRQGTANDLSWWENDGTPAAGAWSEHPIGDPFTPPDGLAAGDLDGDGDTDVVAGSFVSAVELSWWENDGTPAAGTWTEHVLDATAESVRTIELADLDRDGDLDVVFVEANLDAVRWLENDGSPCAPSCAWPQHDIDAAFSLPTYLAIADLDADGDPDVIGQSSLDDLLVWWANDGTPADGGWSEHDIDSVSGGGCPVAAADLDGDGDLDVVSCSSSDASLRWFANDGTPANDSAWAAQGPIVPGPTSIQDVVVADLDADGDPDVAIAVPLNATVEEQFLAWWENTAGDGSAWARHDVADAIDVQRLVAGDLDRDGKLDLAGSDSLGDSIAWWPDGGGQLALAAEDRSSAGLLAGAEDEVLAIVARHRGRSGDAAAELVTLALLFEETAGDPLSSGEANALLDRLDVVLDDGDGTWDGGDATVATVGTLALAAGVQTVALPGGPDVQLAPGAEKTYFVVLAAAAGGAAATPSSFRVTHPAGASTGRDLDADVPLALERAADVSTGTIAVQAGCFFLGLSHTSGGAALVTTPTHSAGCGLDHFVPGEVVSLQAVPDAGWEIGLWSGTDDDLSTATANTVTMPAADHAASVHYVFPDERIVDGDFLSGTQTVEACLEIHAGDVPGVGTPGAQTTVGAGADVTFRAADRVVLYSGFVVRSFTSVRVEIASPTACSP